MRTALSASWIQLVNCITEVIFHSVLNMQLIQYRRYKCILIWGSLCTYALHTSSSWLYCLCVCVVMFVCLLLLCNRRIFFARSSPLPVLSSGSCQFLGQLKCLHLSSTLSGCVSCDFGVAGGLGGSVWRVTLSGDVEQDCCDGDRAGLSVFSLSFCVSVSAP